MSADRRRTSRRLHAAGLVTSLLLAGGLAPVPDQAEGGTGSSSAVEESHLQRTRCVDGMAGDFPCFRIDLLSHLALGDIGGGTGNDVWGWEDPATGREYALMGRSNGTAFVDITDPENPLFVGDLPTQSVASSWRDIKVYDDHALIVSEAPDHGLQVFDLRRLRDVSSPPATFGASARYTGFLRAHNIAVNEDSGFAYAVGAREDEQGCRGGLHMIDVRNPRRPAFAGCFTAAGDSHDVQCVMYAGPDPQHRGKEVCFGSNEDRLAIVDVTDKSNPSLIASRGYEGLGYAHQGWLTDDHRYFLLNDELDEINSGHNTRTYIWDVRNLDAPRVIGLYDGPTTAIDHNLYVRGRDLYEANYRAGLRILRLNRVSQGFINQVAFFDVYPQDDLPDFSGAWSVYPFFDSGVVVVSAIEGGLFVLQPNLPGPLRTAVRGLDTTTANCRNETARERLTVPLQGATSFTCRTAGLPLAPGDRLRVDTFGTAPGGPVSASVSGMTARRVECANLSTGRRVARNTGSLSLSCDGLGVDIAPGQRVRLSFWGTVD